MIQSPIFLVGSPRSGTSLLRQMMDRHPRLAICDETHFFRLMFLGRRAGAFGDLKDAANRKRLVDQYVALRPTQKLGMDCAGLAERLYREATSYPAMFAAVLNYYAESQGKPRCGEKTPRHALVVDKLCEWFPDAVIVHILRDPRDSVASRIRMPFGSPSPIINARVWLKYNLAARWAINRPGYIEVRYERLVAQPEEELTRICEFVGEKFSPSMLASEKAAVEHSSGRDRYRTPLTAGRMGQWRKELSERQVAQIEWVVGPHLESFGYAREVPAASLATIASGLGYAAFDFLRQNVPKLPAALWHQVVKPGEIAGYERSVRTRVWADDEEVSGAPLR